MDGQAVSQAQGSFTLRMIMMDIETETGKWAGIMGIKQTR